MNDWRVRLISLALVLAAASGVFLWGQSKPLVSNALHQAKSAPRRATRSAHRVTADAVWQPVKALVDLENQPNWQTILTRIASTSPEQAPAVVAALQTYVENAGPFIFVERDGVLQAPELPAEVPVSHSTFEIKVEIPKTIGRLAAIAWAHEVGHQDGNGETHSSDLMINYLEQGTSPETWRNRVTWTPAEPDTPELRDLMLSRSSLTGLALACTPRSMQVVTDFDSKGEELLADAKRKAIRLMAACRAR